jgi:metallo-beta-lactamase class B
VGLGLNAIDGPEQVEAYIKSVDRIKSLVARADNPVTVHLTAHPFSTGLSEIRAQLATHQPGQPHPLDDSQALIKQLDALRAAAVERLTVETAKGTKQ